MPLHHPYQNGTPQEKKVEKPGETTTRTGQQQQQQGSVGLGFSLATPPAASGQTPTKLAVTSMAGAPPYGSSSSMGTCC